MSKSPVKVPYNKDVLSLLNELCSINESVIIKKDIENKLLVQRTNNAKTVAYRFIFDAESFNFSGESIAFYKFPELYQLINCFDNPNLEQTDDKIIISKENSKIKYLLSEESTLSKGPSKINFSDPEIALELKSVDIKEIKKMNGLLTTKNTSFKINKDTVDIRLYNDNHDNSFSKSYAPIKSIDREIEMNISSEIFSLIPDGDYLIEIKETGIIRFSLKKEKVSLELFTATIDN